MYTTIPTLDTLMYLSSIGCKHIHLGNAYVQFDCIDNCYYMITLDTPTTNLFTPREFKERVNAHINKRVKKTHLTFEL